MKKIYIKTYGCQMNERDSEAVAALLRHRGYALTDSEGEADAILLNTCSVRDMAERKAMGKMGMLARRKRHRPEVVLGFLGCMAQNRGRSLVHQQPAIDLVAGTSALARVPDHLDRLFAGGPGQSGIRSVRPPLVDLDGAGEAGAALSEHLPVEEGPSRVTAFVNIQQGCDMGCTFCIVPQTRGPERSRTITEIVDEVEQLVRRGTREITLLGQIVTSYGRKTMRRQAGRTPFVQLLEAVHAVEGLQRMRFTSPHPKGFGPDLVAAYRDLPKLCEHAHLPVQSGSNRILKLMKRGYTREQYLRIVDQLRAAQPGIALTTDVIVGFPGESEADFAQTMALMEEVGFDQAFVFKYSPRPGTAAARREDAVPEVVLRERNRAVLEVVDRNAARQLSARVGSVVEILVEGRSEKGGRRMSGRTRTNQIVMCEGSARLAGQLLRVRIERATKVALYGDAAIHNE